MSDKLYPIPLNKLLSWILEEEQHGKIFGYYKELFFHPQVDDPFKMTRYGQIIETPIGVAAGPHTQLAQNIVFAWLFGARYLELKTVQTLDEIEVSKPCIDMTDEGYNCEWSQELKVRQSFDEYLNAWIIIHILRDKFGWREPDNPGLIFNMSVGYDLKGIMNANVQEFFDLMQNCESLLNKKLEEISAIYSSVKNLNIPSQITDNITLSTMHGCPPDEIEKIAKYLIEKKKLHIAIKLNPTLLGPERLRQILNKDLKFDNITVPDEAFEHDLKYEDAIPLIKNLTDSAKRYNVDFGLKLTNTLEVFNTKQILPKKEAINYMSGRILHPISVNLASKLQTEFNGKLDISFSAGADTFNVANILACNIKPVTTCTDVLKPGGYGRLKQYLENINSEFKSTNAKNTDEYIQKVGGKTDIQQAGLSNLQKYSEDVLSNPSYQNTFTEFENIKTERELTQFDCIKAPCIGNCATHQHIPQYIYHTAQGEFDQAYNVIMETNAMPGITGAVCDQLCALKCTRSNYDNPLLIRDIKRFATEYGRNPQGTQRKTNIKCNVAVIGAGPAGLSCAYFLALEGCKVEIFEANKSSGGMVSRAIPKFRLTDKSYQNDIELILDLGVQIHYNSKIDAAKFNQLQKNYDYIFIGTGAQINKKLRIDGEDLTNVIEPVEFLTKVKQNQNVSLGNRVAIIGGGNTAMDAARTAQRLVGKNGEVTILYRRTRKEMPAEDAEIQAALNEGIKLIELVSPLSINGTETVESITCQRMKLGETDKSGRARPISIPNSEFDISLDAIIPAVGQDVSLDFIGSKKLDVNQFTGETNLSKVYAGGDAIRGAATVVDAVGDGQTAAKSILKDAGINGKISYRTHKSISELELQSKAIHREFGIPIPKFHDENKLNFDLIHRTMTKNEVIKEANRCLYCDEVCSVCVYVCPNLANYQYKAESLTATSQKIAQIEGEITISDLAPIEFEQNTQIITIGDFCNECGNCDTFCPTSGAPYKTKPHLFLTEESFRAESEGYYIVDDYIHYKNDDFNEIMKLENDHFLYSNNYLSAILDRKSLNINTLHSKVDYDYLWSSKNAIQMAYLLMNLKDTAIINSNE